MRIGSIPYGGKWRVDVFLKAEVDGDKLSITGVIGPKSNGDADGGCGQISMEFAHRDPTHNYKRYSRLITPDQIQFAPGWSAAQWLDLLDVWEKWHLNDMRPNCEHQTGPEWDTRKELTLYYFRLSPDTEHFRIATAKDQGEALLACRPFIPTQEQTKVALMADRLTFHEATLPKELAGYYVPNWPQYNGDTYNRASEVKTAGWVYPTEHPQGLLCKPCPVCGYAYGAEWRKESLPAAVASFIESLPDTDKTPAWV